ncbi:MAG: electron transport complex subunit RsxC [Fibrobacter sp.]|nr:electron transport complex subunit RsxC [Fibrobacter sp.]
MHTFSHGIHPDQAKLTAASPIQRFPFTQNYVVHLAQNAGSPALAIVQAGQRVLRGQVIARPNGLVSVPVHAPVTGTVKQVGTSLDFNGKPTPSVLIAADPSSDQQIWQTHPQDFVQMSPEQIIEAVRDMGMVGLGGAAFPTHVKLKAPPGHSIKTLILNGAECEPFLTSDHRVMVEQSEDIHLGAQILLKATGAQECVIAIEDNKPDAITAMEEICARQGDKRIRVEVFVAKYPQGAEKMLIKALTGQEVPSGSIPASLGIVVSNIATAAEIGHLLPLGIGLTERVVTITGDGIRKPGNYLIPIGTPLNFILQEVGVVGDPYKIIFGGPMMGKSVAFHDSPITKGTSGIVIFAQPQVADEGQLYNCIRCGACIEACPMHLEPYRLGMLARHHSYETMVQDYHLFDCFECGSCSFVCPSNIPLVQQFRISKQFLRDKERHV